MWTDKYRYKKHLLTAFSLHNRDARNYNVIDKALSYCDR